MAYKALYREFRPSSYNEMVGQEHITKTLRNQIINNRVGHAYLFNGGRGTGKTTAAKILARAVNCLSPQDGEPCNECEICKGILSGAITDVVEMDAASNNSVEDIRSIREEVNFLPTTAKYRVYIIDEVHMLSTGAFNALLKTLEEPPEHVKFILATTEPQKLPATILSRCQRFDFKKLSNENIIKRLKIVCDEAKINITDEALKVISVLAEGAMRDALSILERCMQEAEESKPIDENDVKELVGIPKLVQINKITSAIFDKNIENVLDALNEILNEGKDINNILWEIIKYIKDILVYKVTGKIELYSEAELNDIKKIAEVASKEQLINIIYNLSELENQIKWSTQKNIMFEAGLIKLCNSESTNGLSERIEALENKFNNIGNIKEVRQVVSNPVIEVKPQTKVPEVEKTKTVPKTTSKNVEGLNWENIVSDLRNSGKMMLYTNLINTKVNKINDMTIGIEFPNGLTAFGKTVLEKPENQNELQKRISIACGQEMNIKYIDLKNQKSNQKENAGIESFAKNLDIPIIIEE